MSLTITDLRTAVKAFEEENRKANRSKSIYNNQAASVCKMLQDDIEATKTKEPVSKNRRSSKNNHRPSFCAPDDYSVPEGRKTETLWACKMHRVQCSFIFSIGYNHEQRVLKVLMNNGYAYAYQDVPEAVFTTMKSAKSVGKFYNKIKRNYASVGLV